MEGGDAMTQDPKHSVAYEKSDYDFSLECPEFQARLLTGFLRRAGAKEALPVSDKGANLPNAARQTALPPNP